jgi:hypothetical protein
MLSAPQDEDGIELLHLVVTVLWLLLQAWPSLDVALLRAGQDNAALERLCR